MEVSDQRPPIRPQRRSKKASKNMSFRSLPPLPKPQPIEVRKTRPETSGTPIKPSEVNVSITNSVLVLGDLNEQRFEASPVMHRKWVKLRTSASSFEAENANLSASGVLFRFYCDRNMINNGCEEQEVSTWLDDYEYLKELAAGTGF